MPLIHITSQVSARGRLAARPQELFTRHNPAQLRVLRCVRASATACLLKSVHRTTPTLEEDPVDFTVGKRMAAPAKDTISASAFAFAGALLQAV